MINNGRFGQKFADDVTNECFNVYTSIGKRGKPEVGREWTKMACIIKTDSKDNIEVLTLATGTKCIGEKQRSSSGYILNDSHAEVLARRLFLKYLSKQLIISKDNPEKGIFTRCNDAEVYQLKEGFRFHLFTTDVPCGDAAIFSQNRSKLKQNTNDIILEPNSSNLQFNSLKRKCDNAEIPLKCMKIDHSVSNTSLIDIHRTGAKCVPGGKQDLLEDGEAYHVTGAIRIKPGRGYRTISMSCSDKLMKWCVLGLQSGLLCNFLKFPIYLSTIILSSGVFDKNALKRAISTRDRVKSCTKELNTGDRRTTMLSDNIIGDGEDNILVTHEPVVLQSKFLFSDSKESLLDHTIDVNSIGAITPAGTAILYCPSCSIHEISANGRKHGITKKYFNTGKARTSICKHALYQDYKNCVKQLCEQSKTLDKLNTTYYEEKHNNKSYEQKRGKFFELFNDWIRKPKDQESFY